MKAAVDRAVSFIAAVSAPVLTLLIHEHVIAVTTATDIGGIVAASVAAYHGGSMVQRKSTVKSSATVAGA